MVGSTNYSGGSYLDWLTGKAAMPGLTDAYMALFTATGLDDGTGFTEVTGTGYARLHTVAGDWAGASGTGPSTDSNANLLSFGVAGSDWGVALAIGFYDAPVGGNLKFWTYLGAFQWQPVYIAPASPGSFKASAHGFIVGDQIVFTTEFMGRNPTLSQGSVAGLLTIADITDADTFDVKSGGGATQVNVSASGDGAVLKVAAQHIVQGITVSFAPSNLSLLAA